MKKISEWENFFKNRGIKEELISVYLKRINQLKSKDLPIIFEIEHLSYLTEIKIDILYNMIFSSENFYREFRIPKKKKNEFRTINSPYSSLLSVQNWILKNILDFTKIHYSAHGYIKNKSIKTNATQHLGQNQLYKIDLKDFFPNIKIPRIVNQFKRLGYTKNISLALASLCCYKDYLSQGSPTSPTLSNLVAYKMDKRLTLLAKKNNLIYTRYVDDIAISGENINYQLQKFICKIIEEEGFIINYDKTYLSDSKINKRQLTGIVIKDDYLTIPNNLKKQLKQEVYYISKFGLRSHLFSIKNKNPYYVESLLGKLQYWKFIEPQSKLVKELLENLQNNLS